MQPFSETEPSKHNVQMLQRQSEKQPQKPSPIQRLSGWGKTTILMVIRSRLGCSLLLEEVETFWEKHKLNANAALQMTQHFLTSKYDS